MIQKEKTMIQRLISKNNKIAKNRTLKESEEEVKLLPCIKLLF
jgi:hypothetical protein